PADKDRPPGTGQSLGRSARQEQIGSRTAPQAQQRAPVAARLSLEVEGRPPAANQFQLAQESREVARRIFPENAAGFAENPPGLGGASFRSAIAQQPGP